jgi:ABC-type Mn2+/Zn2+ transport system permease subunit
MMLINIYEDLAAVEGVKISLYNLLYLLSIAIVVALSVYLVGGLITAALIAIPAATAKNISSNLCFYKISAIVCGIISAVAGIFIAQSLSLPAGPMVIISNVALFLFSVVFRKRTF